MEVLCDEVCLTLPHQSDLRWEQRETHEHQGREEMELPYGSTKIGCARELMTSLSVTCWTTESAGHHAEV